MKLLNIILQVKYPQYNIGVDIELQDLSDGNGPRITSWNVPDTQPTNAALAQWAQDNDLLIRQFIAVNKRVYPPIDKQLDMMYNDKINSTTTWQDAITAVKAAFPKPTS